MTRHPTCKKCSASMEIGKALLNIYGGYSDFWGDDRAVTMSPTGQAKLVDVWKCPVCGYSVGKEPK